MGPCLQWEGRSWRGQLLAGTIIMLKICRCVPGGLGSDVGQGVSGRKAMSLILAYPPSWHSPLVTPTAVLPAGDGSWWKRRNRGGTKRPWGGQINPTFLTADSKERQETYVSFLTVLCPAGGQEHCVSPCAWHRAARSSL